MKLYVGNLSWNTDDQGLRLAFENYGEIEEAKVIEDRETGRSRGFGFVTFLNEDEGIEARDAMNGNELDGRQLKVDVAKERAPMGGRDGSRGRSNW